jgi:hypothetical protein
VSALAHSHLPRIRTSHSSINMSIQLQLVDYSRSSALTDHAEIHPFFGTFSGYRIKPERRSVNAPTNTERTNAIIISDSQNEHHSTQDTKAANFCIPCSSSRYNQRGSQQTAPFVRSSQGTDRANCNTSSPDISHLPYFDMQRGR